MDTPIVVGVDPSREHDAALEFAAAQARRRGCPVHLVVVMHPGHLGPDQALEVRLIGEELVHVDRALLGRCVRRIEEWTEDLPDLKVTTEVRHGPVAGSLVDASLGAQLLVLGHHRMTRPQHLPTLSVTSRVAAHTACPVYAVPDDWHELRERTEPVVAAVEDPVSGRRVAATAFAEARLAGTAVLVVRAWCYSDVQADEESLLHGTGTEHGTAVARATEQAFADLIAEHPDVPCRVEAVHGQAAYTLVEASRRARLVVIGRHRPAAEHGSHLGPVTRSVLAHARCPVAVVDTRAPDGSVAGESDGPDGRGAEPESRRRS